MRNSKCKRDSEEETEQGREKHWSGRGDVVFLKKGLKEVYGGFLINVVRL
jgi:hypothetical protein